MDACETSARTASAAARRRRVGVGRERASVLGPSDLMGQAARAFGHRKSVADISSPCSGTGEPRSPKRCNVQCGERGSARIRRQPRRASASARRGISARRWPFISGARPKNVGLFSSGVASSCGEVPMTRISISKGLPTVIGQTNVRFSPPWLKLPALQRDCVARTPALYCRLARASAYPASRRGSFSSSGPPSPPNVDYMRQGDWWSRACRVRAAASSAASSKERAAHYRNAREGTARRR